MSSQNLPKFRLLHTHAHTFASVDGCQWWHSQEVAMLGGGRREGTEEVTLLLALYLLSNLPHMVLLCRPHGRWKELSGSFCS